MNRKQYGAYGDPASGAVDADFSPEATAARLIGRTLTTEEVAGGQFYGSLRPLLLTARDDASLTQTDVAKRLNVGQSEVSRLETSIGPTTGLGRIRNYMVNCDADIWMGTKTATGRRLCGGGCEAEPIVVNGNTPRHTNPDRMPLCASKAKFFPGNMMIDHVRAFEQALTDESVPHEQAARLRRAFLARLQPQQSQAAIGFYYNTGV